MTSHPAFDQGATYSRDGKSLYFVSNRSGEFQIYRSDLNGNGLRQITTNGGWFGVESADGKSLYFLQGPDATATSLWRRALPDGKEEQLVGGIVWWSFWLLDRGIYYIDREETAPSSRDTLGGGVRPGGIDRTRLRYLDLATGATTTVASGLGAIECCISATPDGRLILFTKLDSSIDDLMLVDGF